MNNKTKKSIKIISILLVSLICGALAVYGAIVGLFSYLDSTVEPTKSDLLVTAMGEFTTYKSTSLNNEYLSPIAESDIEDIKLRISEFEFWVSSSGENDKDKSLYENYDFDMSIVDTDDYWFIEYDEVDTKDFELFIFDTETNVLYRFAYSI